VIRFSAMIRNVVVHLISEQPILADVLDAPQPGDATLICRNVRTLDGRRPVFVDRSDSTFVFPYTGIRFVEIPKTSLDLGDDDDGSLVAAAEPEAEPEELEIDEDFLRKVREA
jgi:hypothetical protein